MKAWVLQWVLILVIGLCGYLLVLDGIRFLQVRREDRDTQKMIDHYTDLHQKARGEQANRAFMKTNGAVEQPGN